MIIVILQTAVSVVVLGTGTHVISNVSLPSLGNPFIIAFVWVPPGAGDCNGGSDAGAVTGQAPWPLCTLRKSSGRGRGWAEAEAELGCSEGPGRSHSKLGAGKALKLIFPKAWRLSLTGPGTGCRLPWWGDGRRAPSPGRGAPSPRQGPERKQCHHPEGHEGGAPHPPSHFLFRFSK